jgi:TetR/AcrR family transcriptional regulator, transcriptional repressor for nem operon
MPDQSKAQFLEAAIKHFWKHGYEASSTDALASAMGISLAQLHIGFGDKRELFWAALEYYSASDFERRIACLESGNRTPQRTLKALFVKIVDHSMNESDEQECLLVISALEVAPHDREFQNGIANLLAKMEAVIYRWVEAGQRCGEFSLLRSTEDSARLLLGVLVGIRALALVRPDREALIGLVDSALASLRD